jgi:hypothetical protein
MPALIRHNPFALAGSMTSTPKHTMNLAAMRMGDPLGAGGRGREGAKSWSRGRHRSATATHALPFFLRYPSDCP